MKLFAALFFTFVALSTANTKVHSRGCIYALGTCIRECEVGTHGYGVGCGHITPEPTCYQPHPVEEEAVICDYTACYCDPPTVRNTITKECVPLEKCPKK